MTVMTCVKGEAKGEFSGTRVILVHNFTAPRRFGNADSRFTGSEGFDGGILSWYSIAIGKISLDSVHVV